MSETLSSRERNRQTQAQRLGLSADATWDAIDAALTERNRIAAVRELGLHEKATWPEINEALNRSFGR
jgi:hypothetical protein